jgi:hypothetical protein
MTATLTPLDAALMYARLGWPVVPLHTPVAGVCDCPKRSACISPGKHPRTMRGVDDSSTDEEKIRRWWHMWPTANVAVDLVRAGIVDVAPDSIQWQAEFIARGLPRTVSFQSGGGDGHEHHFYRRSDICPAHRSCHPDEYDIMSAGYAVMPSSLHQSGQRYAWLNSPDSLDMAPVPAWVVEHLQSQVRPRLNVNGTSHALDADEAPVQLAGDDLALWNGELVRLKEDGSIDRSLSLWEIGRALARAGASRSAIARALQDRDEVLGWSKYTGRRDAQTRYLVIAERALSGEAPRVRLKPVEPQVKSGNVSTPAAWPEPEDRGLATLSDLGTVEYVEDLVRPGRIVVWAAEEGSGKSYTVDGELAIRSIAAGGSLAGTWPVVGRHSVLVLSEMHSDDDYQREDVVLQSLGLTRDALRGMYWRLPLMTAAHGQPCLQVPEWCSWCVQWCKSKSVELLIVDTATGATDVNPWGHEMQAVYRQLRLMLDAYPSLAIILIVHCKKPQQGTKGERRITDVIGEWGRWCDVIVMQERESLSAVKLTTFKRVRHMRKVKATQQGGLLIDPISLDEAATPKVHPSKVLEVVSDLPGITHQRLAELLGVSKRTASKYCDEAERRGELYQLTGEKGTKYVYATAQDGNTAQ